MEAAAGYQPAACLAVYFVSHLPSLSAGSEKVVEDPHSN